MSETAAELIDALLEEGEAVDSGSFTLDIERASAKLEAFQYADRRAYLVPIFEALVGFGARTINLTTNGRDLMISAEGVTLEQPLAGLAKLHVRQLSEGEQLRERLLARLSVGLDMALGIGELARVVVSYSDTEHMHVAEYRRESSPRLARSSAQVTGELRILVDYAGVNLLGDRHDVLECLYPAVKFTEVEIRVDGDLISQRPRERGYTVEGQGPGFRYEAWLVALEQAQIELWSHGVRVGRLRSPHENLAAVLHLERPRRDLSQLEIVRDELVEAGLDELAKAREQLLEARERHARERAERAEKSRLEREQRAAEEREQAEEAELRRQREMEALADALSPRRKLLAFAAYGLAMVLGTAGVLLVQRARPMGIGLVLVALAVGAGSLKTVNLALSEDTDGIPVLVVVALVVVMLLCAVYNSSYPPFS